MTHHIQVLPQFFHKVWSGSARFVIKEYDADYRVGDKIEIQEEPHGFFKPNSVVETIREVYVSKQRPNNNKRFVVIQF